MLIEKLLKVAETQKIHIFLDMDGTLVEFDTDANNLRKQRGSHYYVGKRPLTYIINKVKELTACPNIELHILSNCNLTEQKQQKIDWINQYLPFIKESNIHIICYEEVSFTKEEKPYLKGRLIKSLITNNEKSYLIDDDAKNIIYANSFDDVEAHHVTEIID